ncbi:MAG TPA: hypothetical protein VFL62_19245 [Bradyrhizobium sp.]|uniref:hypothetical protein n=1 Tax=Bradyrhizobium sp. TaxID=376 RepID=UPI002D81066E|nr:hypothetical protein [Bradyrhizobium sp.]HET7888365.1 hypothetical protein [Bradyrhizobium sp.]
MNWAWADTLDQMWRAPAFPMWLTLAAAGFFAVIVLITLLRAEKSVANGALTVITLLAVGIALAAVTRGFGPGGTEAGGDTAPPPSAAMLPALACVDDLAGETVLTACEKAVFGSPEATAAALSYAARQISRLTAYGDVVAANKNMTSSLQALRRSVQNDRYGLMAEVLVARDHCTPSDCAAFRSLTDRSRITANIEERTYDGMVARYAALWNAPPAAAPAVAATVAPLIPGMPTGRPTNAEFPSASSTPAVSIMTAEPPLAAARAAGASANANAAQTPPPKPSSSAASPAPPAAAKKQAAAPKAPRTPAPATSLAPSAPAPTASQD